MRSNFKSIIDSNVPVLVDFFATWCGPCKALAPILDAVKEDLGEEIKIVKVDVDKNQTLAGNYRVLGVPTLLLFNNGRLVWRQSGVIQKSDLISIIAAKTS
ncbi:MAG: thioredoxin [Bacteroidota bacterium]